MIIEEDYVSFEVAKLLKERGFDEPCLSYFWTEENGVNIDYCDIPFTNKQLYSGQTLRPTHQMAMKWLREEKNIIVNVWYDGVDWEAEYYNDEDEGFYLITDYSCNSYEEAVEAAIKYCLENLI